MKISKKIMCLIVLVLIFLIGLSINTESNAATITLEQIVEKINSSKDVAKFKEDGYTIEATCTDNTITMTNTFINIEGNTITNTSPTYTLTDNILTSTHLGNYDIFTFELLMNAIGQLHGYNDGSVYSVLVNRRYLYSEYFADCTLENDGFEYDSENCIMKINIDKKTPLEAYISLILEPEDYYNMLEAGGNRIIRRGDLASNDPKVLLSNEPGSENSMYRSFMNGLEALCNRQNDFEPEQGLAYIKENYPELIVGTTKLYGISIYYGSVGEFCDEYNQSLMMCTYTYGADFHSDSMMIAIVDYDTEKIKEVIENPSLNIPEYPEDPENPDDPTNPGNPGTPEEPGVEPDPGTGDGNGSGNGSGSGNGTGTGNGSGNGTGSGDASGNLIKYPNAGIENAGLITGLVVLIILSVIAVIIITLKDKKDIK